MKIGANRMVSFADRAAGGRMIGAANSPSATMVREAQPQP